MTRDEAVELSWRVALANFAAAMLNGGCAIAQFMVFDNPRLALFLTGIAALNLWCFVDTKIRWERIKAGP